MVWLEMPLPLLSAYVKALPRQKAQESLRNATEVFVGQGHKEGKSIQGGWLADAGQASSDSDRKRIGAVKLNPLNPLMAEQLGIAIQIVKLE